jgi:hypothetical protein
VDEPISAEGMTTEGAGGTDAPIGGAFRASKAPALLHPDTLPHTLMLLAAGWVAWRPVETRPATAVVLAGLVLALSFWGWRHGTRGSSTLAAASIGIFVLAASTFSGWDAARGVGEIGTIAVVLAVIWLASRTDPPDGYPELLALALAGLAVWGLWQVITGLEALRPALEALPQAARIYAEERLASRRAFASLPLPSHLAVLLATALPLLLARVRASAAGLTWALAAVLAVLGLVATRSPVGVGLALLACGALAARRSRLVLVVTTVLLAVALAGVAVVRSDVGQLEPVVLRLDNWRTALWLAGTAPAAGVGLASYAQATQVTPLEVGNRPAHAHNLPLEWLAEFGPAGLIGFAFAAAGLLALVWRLWPRAPALAVSLMVIPLHNLVDFSLYVSGVAVPWALLVGWGSAISAGERTNAGARQGGFGAIVAAAAVGLVLAGAHASSGVIETTAAADRDPGVRFAGALRALDVAPWRIQPQFLLASAAIESQDQTLLDRAWEELDSRRWLRPRSAALAERRARVALARGVVSVAMSELWLAAEMGGAGRDGPGLYRELLLELEGGDRAASD